MAAGRVDVAAAQKQLVTRLRRLGSRGLRGFEREMRETARRNELTYTLEDGRTIVMPLLAAPSLLLAGDVERLHRLCRVLLSAFRKTTRARKRDPEVRALLALSPEEEAWLELAPARMSPLIGRFDVNVDPSVGASSARLLELNGCAIGGIHYGPATSQTLLAHVGQLAGAHPPRMPFAMSQIWLDLCRRHARSLGGGGGRRPIRIVWLENRDWEAGITEGPTLIDLARRAGCDAELADPRDLAVRRGQLTALGRPVDIVYRSMDVRDLIDIEDEEGARLRGMREAVRRGHVLSPMEGDLDHKSLLEVWSSPRFARLFSREERAALRSHVPWTRLLGERRTTGPDGAEIDLPAYARRGRARLVIKPNRACGGEGILIGRDTTAQRWDRALARAISGRSPAVVQELVRGATMPSPAVRGGSIVIERHYTNYGLMASATRLGILGRAAPFPVVNVSRGGGVLGVLLV